MLLLMLAVAAPAAPPMARAQREVTTPGKVKLLAGDPKGLALWFDGKPTPIADETTLDPPTGKHRLTLAVNRTTHRQPLRLEVAEVEGSKANVQVVGGK